MTVSLYGNNMKAGIRLKPQKPDVPNTRVFTIRSNSELALTQLHNFHFIAQH